MTDELVRDTIAAIGEPDEDARRAARERQGVLTKPPGSLGRLEELSIQLAGIRGTARPRFAGKAVVVFAANHGVVAEGVSAYPAEVTGQMVANFLPAARRSTCSRAAGARARGGCRRERRAHDHRAWCGGRSRAARATSPGGSAMTRDETLAAMPWGSRWSRGSSPAGPTYSPSARWGIGGDRRAIISVHRRARGRSWALPASTTPRSRARSRR